MSLYADYDGHRAKLPALDSSSELCIEPATDGDLAAIAAISAAREGSSEDKELIGFTSFFLTCREAGGGMLFAARLAGKVIGYAKCGCFSPPADAPANCAPRGWYLLGVVVAPEFRGRSVGTQLTLTRLDWIAQRAESAFYFANARNRVSIEFHERFGFEERTRHFWFPGVDFEGGSGILYEWRRRRNVRARLAPQG